ncbi:MAG: hypothetical protein AAGE88_00845 [Actinomycetota bacterium]
MPSMRSVGLIVAAVVLAACSGGADPAATSASGPDRSVAIDATEAAEVVTAATDDGTVDDGAEQAAAAEASTVSSAVGPPTTAPGAADPSSTTTVPPSSTSTIQTSSTAAPPPAPAVSGDPSNPIAVPVGLLDGVAAGGAARCIFVDLQSVPVPPNPGYVGETVEGQSISGDELWAVTFYLMLYTNCERQARGLDPFGMYPADKQLAMQQTVLGIAESHGGFGERADIAGGVTAEGHGGGPRPGEPINHDVGEDSDADGLWSPNEIGRRAASGNQMNGNTRLVDHGGAMTAEKYSCVFAAASLGARADHRVDVIIFYGNVC